MASNFNVILKSTKKFSGNSTNDLTYAIDWNFLTEGQYEVRFCFRTNTANMDFNKDVASISFPDLAPSYNFEALDTHMSASTSSLVGFLKMQEVRNNSTDSAKMYHYSNYNDNPCFIVNKPQNNFLSTS